jgi:hypothetical protein
MRLDICFIEHQDKGKFCLVENTTSRGENLIKNGERMRAIFHHRNTAVQNTEISTYLQAYSIFDMKVAGAVVRGVSIIYATTVGRDEATASVMMAPEADQVKISICPGVSKIT